MTTSTLHTHAGRTRRITVIAAVCVTGFLGLGVVAGAGTGRTAHPGGGLTSTATPTATTSSTP